ncbi:MAG: hypothetical protein WCS66_09040, partial [Bacteroidales bacterium]
KNYAGIAIYFQRINGIAAWFYTNGKHIAYVNITNKIAGKSPLCILSSSTTLGFSKNCCTVITT